MHRNLLMMEIWHTNCQDIEDQAKQHRWRTQTVKDSGNNITTAGALPMLLTTRKLSPLKKPHNNKLSYLNSQQSLFMVMLSWHTNPCCGFIFWNKSSYKTPTETRYLNSPESVTLKARPMIFPDKIIAGEVFAMLSTGTTMCWKPT